jgi:hypothetical protein
MSYLPTVLLFRFFFNDRLLLNWRLLIRVIVLFVQVMFKEELKFLALIQFLLLNFMFFMIFHFKYTYLLVINLINFLFSLYILDWCYILLLVCYLQWFSFLLMFNCQLFLFLNFCFDLLNSLSCLLLYTFRSHIHIFDSCILITWQSASILTQLINYIQSITTIHYYMNDLALEVSLYWYCF